MIARLLLYDQSPKQSTMEKRERIGLSSLADDHRPGISEDYPRSEVVFTQPIAVTRRRNLAKKITHWVLHESMNVEANFDDDEDDGEFRDRSTARDRNVNAAKSPSTSEFSCHCVDDKPCNIKAKDARFVREQQRYHRDRETALTCAVVDVIFGLFGFIVVFGCIPFWFGIAAILCACKEEPNIPRALYCAKVGMATIALPAVLLVAMQVAFLVFLFKGHDWFVANNSNKE